MSIAPKLLLWQPTDYGLKFLTESPLIPHRPNTHKCCAIGLIIGAPALSDAIGANHRPLNLRQDIKVRVLLKSTHILPANKISWPPRADFGIPIAWYKARILVFPRKSIREGASSLFGPGLEKTTCSFPYRFPGKNRNSGPCTRQSGSQELILKTEGMGGSSRCVCTEQCLEHYGVDHFLCCGLLRVRTDNDKLN